MDDLQKIISKYSNKKLPRDHSLSFETIVIKSPIIENQLKTNKYPILFRFHHALADGDSITRIFYEIYNSKNNDNGYITKTNTNSTYFKRILTQFCVYILPVLISFEQLIRNLFRNKENHILCATEITGEKIVRWKVENDLYKYLKKTKENIPAVTYTTIILTALCESLSKYFLKNTNSEPEMLQIVFPLSTTKVVPKDLNKKLKDSKLNNNYIVTTVQFPLKYDEQNKTILNRSKIIRNTINKIEFKYFLFYYFASEFVAKYLPEPLLKLLRTLENSSVGFSYYIEKSADWLIGSSPIVNVMFWVPNGIWTGLTVSVFDCNNNLNFGLLADKSVISNKNDIDEILQNMIDSIKNLAEEVEDKNIG